MVSIFQTPLLVFDIETAPDVKLGRLLLDEPEGGWLNDAHVAEAMFAKAREASGGKSDFLRHHLHQVVAISAIFRSEKTFHLASMGEPGSSEADLLKAFFGAIDKSKPTLVGWNTGGFDLTVLTLRALKLGVQAAGYWDTSDKWNNYLGRYHNRHLDLMDILPRYQSSGRLSLNDAATMCGFPGKLGMDGSKVWSAYQAGEIEAIRNYCEHDVLSLYLVFLRFELMRARLTPDAYETELENVRTMLRDSGKPHHAEYLEAWKACQI